LKIAGNPFDIAQDGLRDGAARLRRANAKVGNPFVLGSPAGASRSTGDFFNRLLGLALADAKSG